MQEESTDTPDAALGRARASPVLPAFRRISSTGGLRSAATAPAPRGDRRLDPMHGEYKVPGGKLVVVDFDVVDGVIRDARVAGDFFLEPDEALGDIDGALERAARGIRRQADRRGGHGRAPRRRRHARVLGRGGRRRGAPGADAMPRAGRTTTGRSCTTPPCRRACTSRSTRCSPPAWATGAASRRCGSGSGTSRPW